MDETVTVEDEHTANTIEKDELGSGTTGGEDAPHIRQFTKPAPSELIDSTDVEFFWEHKYC